MKNLTKLARRENDPAQLFEIASGKDVVPREIFAPVILKVDSRLTSAEQEKARAEEISKVNPNATAYETGKGKYSESHMYVEYVPITPYIL